MHCITLLLKTLTIAVWPQLTFSKTISWTTEQIFLNHRLHVHIYNFITFSHPNSRLDTSQHINGYNPVLHLLRLILCVSSWIILNTFFECCVTSWRSLRDCAQHVLQGFTKCSTFLTGVWQEGVGSSGCVSYTPALWETKHFYSWVSFYDQVQHLWQKTCVWCCCISHTFIPGWSSDIWNKGLTFLPKGPTECVLCVKGVSDTKPWLRGCTEEWRYLDFTRKKQVLQTQIRGVLIYKWFL